MRPPGPESQVLLTNPPRPYHAEIEALLNLFPPDILGEISIPAFPFGYWWVDVHSGGKMYVIQHKLGGVYGVSRIKGDETPFDPPEAWDETCPTIDDVVAYLKREKVLP